MTGFEKFRLGVVLALMLLALPLGGWTAALGVLFLCGFLMGVWVIVSAGVDAFLGPQEPPRGPYDSDLDPDYDPRDGDPTRPQDAENVIDLRKHEWRRAR